MSKIGMVILSIVLLSVILWVAGPQQTWENFQLFPPLSIVGIFALLSFNLGVVSVRLWRVLAHFQLSIPLWTAFRASVSGHLAGLMLFSIFGQVVGRHLVLRKQGVTSLFVASLTAYERVLLILVGGSLSAIGALKLIEQSLLQSFLDNLSLYEIMFTASLGIGASLWFGRSKFESELIVKLWRIRVLGNFVESLLTTFLAQGLVLSAFVVAVLSISPDADILSVLAAAAIISFAASLPITLNGWGVREITSVYTLGLLGIPISSALAASILIGVISTAIILLAAPVAISKKTQASSPLSNDEISPFGNAYDLEKIAIWALAMAAGVLIFFQLHIALPSGTVNLNLADPFALLALAVISIQMFSTRKWPRWNVPSMNVALGLLTLMIIIGFYRGVSEIGVTQWALASRLFGWFVLLGYVSIGYLLVSTMGMRAVRRFGETIFMTAVVVVCVQIVARWLQFYDLDMFMIPPNFEGFAANRNAFAFQMLVSSAWMLAYSHVHFKNTNIMRLKPIVMSLMQGVILLGILYSASMGGLIAGLSLVIFALIFGFAERRFVLLSVLFCTILWVMPDILAYAQEVLASYYLGFFDLTAKGPTIQVAYSGSSSHQVRWQTIVKGLELWLQWPIFGAGLGVFIDQSMSWIDRPTVIHNTPVWFLAEFGLVGLAIMAWCFYVLIRYSWRQSHGNAGRNAGRNTLMLLLFVFALFSLVHEIFFQRIFWLSLGALAGGSVYSQTIRNMGRKLICHVITGLNAGGAERMLARLVTAPKQAGVEHQVVSLMDEGVFGEKIRANNVKLDALNMGSGFSAPWGIWKLVRLLHRDRPDVLMTWLYHADLMGMIASNLTGVKRIYWNLRCSDMTKANTSLPYQILMKLLIWLSSQPTKIVVNSFAGKNHHENLGYIPKQWQVISNGVNLDEFHPRPDARNTLIEELGLPKHVKLIGHVARFHPMKDYGTFLAAAEKVAEQNPMAHFILLGKNVDNSNPFFKSFLSNPSLSGRLHLLGGDRKIPELLAAFDQFVLSSSFGEGSPNVVIEAMASGVPCVVTNVGDAARIVGELGNVVDIGNVHEMATAMVEQLNLDDDTHEKLCQQVRQRAEEMYSIDGIVEQYKKLFSDRKVEP